MHSLFPRKENNRKHFCEKRVPTLQQRLVRRRRLAIATIIASLGIVGRSYVANLEPTYPVGEGDYCENTTSERSNLKQPNAATFYMAAADAFPVDIAKGMEYGPLGLLDEPLAVQEVAVKRAQPAFALLRQGMKYPFSSEVSTGFLVEYSNVPGSLPIHNYAPLREMARMLAVESRFKAKNGDADGALQSALDAVYLGIDCGQGDSLLAGMAGVLFQMTGTIEAAQHIDGLSATGARAGAERLEAMLKRERTFPQMLTAERDSLSYDTLDSIFNSGTLYGFNPITGDEIDMRSAPWRFAISSVIFAYTKQGLVDDFAAQFDRLLTRAKMPYQLAVRLKEVPNSSNPLVNYWLDPDFQRAQFQTTQQSAYSRVLLTQLAIEAYKKEHSGTAPTSLEDLTAGIKPYFHAVPKDPFSISGTVPLCYDAQTAKAYSVGENGRDDGNKGDDNSRLYK